MPRDRYLGYEIDYSNDHDGYRVIAEVCKDDGSFERQIVHEAKSYDDACVWIEETNR